MFLIKQMMEYLSQMAQENMGNFKGKIKFNSLLQYSLNVIKHFESDFDKNSVIKKWKEHYEGYFFQNYEEYEFNKILDTYRPYVSKAMGYLKTQTASDNYFENIDLKKRPFCVWIEKNA